jgi:hypothetical protein
MSYEDKWVEEAFLQGQRYIVSLEEEIAELRAQVEQLRGFVQWVADREHMTVEVTPKMAREARAALAGNED